MFLDEYRFDSDLLRSHKIHDPVQLLRSIDRISAVKEQYKAAEGFAPAKASFITEDEIDRLLIDGPHISEFKPQIYSYFVQGHNARECTDFLKKSCGISGSSRVGYDEQYDAKGIRLSRSDDFSGGNYDTVTLSWSQAQKRIRGLIESGKYLSKREKASLPAYEKLVIARKIYAFNYHNPKRTASHEWDPEAAKRDILPLLDSPKRVEKIFNQMLSDFAPLSPDTPHYRMMQLALRDVAAYQRGESPLFAPLPEEALEAERRILQAGEPSPLQRTDLEASDAPEGTRKMQTGMRESRDGQLSLDLLNAAAPGPQPEMPDAAYFDSYSTIKEENPGSIVLYHVGDFYEMYGEDARTAASLLGLALTTRDLPGMGQVDMCGFAAKDFDHSVFEKLRENHAVTLGQRTYKAAGPRPR